jgi:putative ABC transport system substrate-binding protein
MGYARFMSTRNNRRRVSRRSFLIAPPAWIAIAWTGTALGQSKKPPIVIGWLASGSHGNTDFRIAFDGELAALGWRTGSQVVIEMRYADGQAERLPALAEELAAKKPALMVTTTIASTRAAAKAAPLTPVVMIGGGDLVASGLAASHARPGGMITGISQISTEISEKYLELLIHAGSKPRRVGFLFWSASGVLQQNKENMRRSAARYAIEERAAEVARPEEIEPVLKRLAKEGIQALVVMSNGGPFLTERKRIAQFALEQRWPVIGGALWADDGALLSYSADPSAAYRRGAHHVARILKGARPGDLPIERAMTFELVLNKRTAKALGLVIPHEFGARVDRVIE